MAGGGPARAPVVRRSGERGFRAQSIDQCVDEGTDLRGRLPPLEVDDVDR